METIKFTCHGNSSPAYSCNKPGDNSGEYVSLDVAEEMRDLIIDLYVELRSIDTSQALKHADEMRDKIGI